MVNWLLLGATSATAYRERRRQMEEEGRKSRSESGSPRSQNDERHFYNVRNMNSHILGQEKRQWEKDGTFDSMSNEEYQSKAEEVEHLANYIVNHDATVTRQAAKIFQQEYPDQKFTEKMRYQWPHLMECMAKAGRSLREAEQQKKAAREGKERSIIERIRERIRNM